MDSPVFSSLNLLQSRHTIGIVLKIEQPKKLFHVHL